MIKKAIAMMSLVIMISGCSKNDDGNTPDGTFVHDYMDIMYVNEQSKNLLDSSTEHAIDLNNLNLYYFRNNDTVKVTNPFERSDPGFLKLDEGDTTLLRMFFGVNIHEDATGEQKGELIGRSLRFIELYPGDLDTLTADWISTKRTGHAITRVSYNGKVVFDAARNINYFEQRTGFKITK